MKREWKEEENKKLGTVGGWEQPAGGRKSLRERDCQKREGIFQIFQRDLTQFTCISCIL